MLDSIDKSTNNFCKNITALELVPAKNISKNLYGSAIAIFENSVEYQCYLLFHKHTLNEFAKALLFEDNLQEEDLDDLCKEVANLIVGSAKMLLEEQNPACSYRIATPVFLGHVPNMKLLTLEEFLLYKIKNRSFAIGIKATCG